MFAYTFVHLTFLTPQIVLRARVYANAYLAVITVSLSPSIKTFTHIKFRFFNGKQLQYYLRRTVTIDIFSNTTKEEKITQYDVIHTRQDCTCLKSKINANVIINKSTCRFKYKIDLSTLNIKMWISFQINQYMREIFYMQFTIIIF